MSNYNERIDNILGQLMSKTADASYGEWQVVGLPEAKQAITSLIKELVAGAKPKAFKFDDGQNDATHFYNKAVSEYQQNLLKELEEV